MDISSKKTSKKGGGCLPDQSLQRLNGKGTGCGAGAAGRSGLLSCSGACYQALLSKRSTVVAMGENTELFIDICFTAPTLALIYGDSIATEAFKKDLRSFEKIITVEGCRTGCAAMLLNTMNVKPTTQLYLSNGHRSHNGRAITPEEYLAINKAIPGVVARIIKANSMD